MIRYISALFLCAVLAAAPRVTHVTGTLYDPTTGLLTGELIFELNVATGVADGSPIGGKKRITVGSDGAVAVDLVPNSAITPINTYYRVTRIARPVNSATRDTKTDTLVWVVPDTTTATIADVETLQTPTTTATYLPSQISTSGASSGQFVGYNGTTVGWRDAVSSIALSLPGIFTVSGSPVTTTGTLSASLATQLANRVWAGPTTGSAAAPTFRALVAADIPSLSYLSPSNNLSDVSNATTARSNLGAVGGPDNLTSVGAVTYVQASGIATQSQMLAVDPATQIVTINGSPSFVTPSSLAHWSAALGRVQAGSGNAKVACIGDSRTTGFYSAGPTGNQKTKSWCTQLANIFASLGVPASSQNFLGDGVGTNQDIDSRVSIGSWSASSPSVAGLRSLGGAFFYTTGATQFSFTPTVEVDTCVFYYPKGSGFGTVSFQIDALSATSVNQNGATAFASTTVTATLGTHSCNASRTAGTGFIIGIEAYNSASKQVLFQNWGWSSATAGTLIAGGSTAYGYDPISAATVLAPDLAIIAAMVNDEYNATPINTYKSNLTALIDSFRASGVTDVVIVAESHIDPIYASETVQKTYVDAVKAVAASYSPPIPVIDEFSSFVSYSSQAANNQNADGLHMTATGYGKMAFDISRVLR